MLKNEEHMARIDNLISKMNSTNVSKVTKKVVTLIDDYETQQAKLPAVS
jgi:hypothetical protein